ncbi:PREDICTED: neuroendocrine secretory protein 55-like [Propithecus coquereli]|uniref:neuroendocrine secretory protein 55-like n=1 Tax=Propithecus coquereli TaxID=379532 RepID=UPI00063EDA61|nr:PREDICTED: neuroendocrine secretory protein 55-like [Propithecus coquereli]
MDRRSRAQQWRRARQNYYDLCPPIGRRTAAALLWLSCSIALLRALAASNARAQQQRLAAQQRRSFLNAHHRSDDQVFPETPESESDYEHDEVDLDLSLPECAEYDDFEYELESNNDFENDFDSDFDTEPDSAAEPDSAPTTEPETEPEDDRGPVVPKQSTSTQSFTQRLYALRLRSPDASPSRAPPSTQEPQSPREGEEPEPEPKDKDPRAPEESEEPKKEKKQQRRCKPKKSTRRDPSPESPSKKGPIPIRRH